MNDRELLKIAKDAAENAYVPYSKFPVGAALECSDGAIYTGCNIENSSIGNTICAERVAVAKAVSDGNRGFMRLAIYSEGENYCMPCGSCRQFIYEFTPDVEILCAKADGRYVSYKLRQLLPHAFEL
jgi:cytidine deaminase